MKHCFQCGNKGTKEGCPGCGRVSSEISIEKMPKEVADEARYKFKAVRIPEGYMNSSWSLETFWKGREGARYDTALIRFANSLNRMITTFAEGSIPNKSAYIIAPFGYSKCTFAYSCMKHAIDNGYSVAPMLDTGELKQLFTGSTTQSHCMLYHTWDINDIILADVCFVTVMKEYLHLDAFLTIQDLIDRRSRFDKPTFAISAFSLEEISGWDKYKSYKKLLTTTDSSNALKYPLIVEYKEVKQDGEDNQIRA